MTPILTSSSPQFDQFRFSALSQRPQDHFRFSTQFPGEQNQISSIWLLSHKKTQGNKRQGLHGRRSIQIWKHFKQVLCQRLLQLEEEPHALEQDTKGTFTSFLLACRIKPRQACWKQLPNVSSCLLVGSFLPPRTRPLHHTTLPAANCQTLMDVGQRWYTHAAFLNINDRARPSCKTDVRQYDCTVVVSSTGPRAPCSLVYLSCLVLCFEMLLLSSAALWFQFCVIIILEEHLIGFLFSVPSQYFLQQFISSSPSSLVLLIIVSSQSPTRDVWSSKLANLPPASIVPVGDYLGLHFWSVCVSFEEMKSPLLY